MISGAMLNYEVGGDRRRYPGMSSPEGFQGLQAALRAAIVQKILLCIYLKGSRADKKMKRSCTWWVLLHPFPVIEKNVAYRHRRCPLRDVEYRLRCKNPNYHDEHSCCRLAYVIQQLCLNTTRSYYWNSKAPEHYDCQATFPLQAGETQADRCEAAEADPFHELYKKSGGGSANAFNQ